MHLCWKLDTQELFQKAQVLPSHGNGETPRADFMQERPDQTMLRHSRHWVWYWYQCSVSSATVVNLKSIPGHNSRAGRRLVELNSRSRVSHHLLALGGGLMPPGGPRHISLTVQK